MIDINTNTETELDLEYRRALDANNVELLVQLSLEMDRRETTRTYASLGGAALWYVKQGLKVFPLTPNTKVPFKGSHGCKDASSEIDLIAYWWSNSPNANIGIATGHLIDVVDIDGSTGQKTRASLWCEIFERIDSDQVGKVSTPRNGGMHIYVPATGDGNSAGILPGVDYRGAGGYVVAPPSTINQGRYRFLGTPRLTSLRDWSAA